MMTLGTLISPPTQRRRAAQGQFGQRAADLRRRLTGMALEEGERVFPQQVDYLESRSGGFRFGSLSSGRSHNGHCRTGSQSIGLGVECK